MFGIEKKNQEITISNRTVIRVLVITALAVLLARIFENMIHPLTLIFVSFFLAMALNPAVNWVAKRLKNRNRTKATAVAYVTVMTVLIGFFALVVPPLANQTREFISDVPNIVRDLKNDEGAVGDLVRRYELEEQVTQFANDWSKDFSSVTNNAVSLANRVVSNLISIITVLVLTFMMLIEGPKWISAFWRQYPKEKQKHARVIVSRMYAVVTNYVNGQVLVAAIGASFAIITLFITTTIFDASSVNAIALGGLVFLFGLIPMFGATLAAIVVVLFSLFASVPLAITMAIYFVVYQQIENVTIQPYIQSRGNELTPMLVFIAAILGIGFGGIVGAFISIPVAGCIKILADDYIDRRDQQKNVKA